MQSEVIFLKYKERIVMAYFEKLDDDRKDMAIDFVKELYNDFEKSFDNVLKEGDIQNASHSDLSPR